MKPKLREAIYIRLSPYNRKRLEIVVEEFESNISDTARLAIESSLDKTFETHPKLLEKLK